MHSTHSTWQQELAAALTNVTELLNYLNIPADYYSSAAAKQFSLRVPLGYAACIEKNNIHDPLLKQILPNAQELDAHTDFLDDPVGDLNALKNDCIIHKYHGRVLLIATGGCAINCRFCFRRNFPYSDVQLTQQKEVTILDYLRENSSINEVILSGGDPLLLSDQRIKHLLTQFAQIPHIQRIRIHSRIPIVLPSRFTAELIEILQQSPLPIIMVTHCNHANELSNTVKNTCIILKHTNITLLNQSVLLQGINDSVEILQALSERLFSCGILPYYLHLLDKANGTAHFEVQQDQAIQIHRQLQQQLPGYLVPKLVKEEPGEKSKTWLI